jgi:hypothetical protein
MDEYEALTGQLQVRHFSGQLTRGAGVNTKRMCKLCQPAYEGRADCVHNMDEQEALTGQLQVSHMCRSTNVCRHRTCGPGAIRGELTSTCTDLRKLYAPAYEGVADCAQPHSMSVGLSQNTCRFGA